MLLWFIFRFKYDEMRITFTKKCIYDHLEGPI